MQPIDPSRWLPRRKVLTVVLALFLFSLTRQPVCADSPVVQLARDSQQRVVKIYGAGGLSGLEAYQSGFLVSPDGHIATAWSYVLDVVPIVLLDDGRRFEAEIIGFEPALELAVLKIDAGDLPYFRFGESDAMQWGDPVLAVSNLFNIATGEEPASVMQGTIASVSRLNARSGALKTPYNGTVYVLDLIANNPGAAGGALVNLSGQLVGMLGKELRDAETGVWLNYAIPASATKGVIGDIIAGRLTTQVDSEQPTLPRERAHSAMTLGLDLVPDVLESTPVFVDSVRRDGPGWRAGVRPNDLILLINGKRVESQRVMQQVLRTIDRRDNVQLTVQRENQIIPLSLRP